VLSPDARGRVTERNSQTVFDVAALPVLRHLGHAEAFARASPDAPDPVAPGHFAAALDACQRTLRTTAPFDGFHEGDEHALDARRPAGVRAFTARATLESLTGDGPPQFAPPGCAQPCG
jgi:cytochrome c peroxidase